ncbi:hypothetical protein [Streptomyces cadmiisoli]|nr:hypothetical protein [Streptomyces cadmiisoli]
MVLTSGRQAAQQLRLIDSWIAAEERRETVRRHDEKGRPNPLNSLMPYDLMLPLSVSGMPGHEFPATRRGTLMRRATAQRRRVSHTDAPVPTMGDHTLKRTITVAVLLAALATLTACTSSDDSSDSRTNTRPPASSTPTKEATEEAAPSVGLPPEPTGKVRDGLLAALFDINPALITDEDGAVDNARNQCMAINGGAQELDRTAQQRFSSGEHAVTAAEAKQINIALSDFCKTA